MRRLIFAVLVGCTSASNDPGDAGATADAGEMEDTMMEPEDTGPPPCEYPPGPYGYVLGSIVSLGIQWQGYPPKSSTEATLTTKDLYDCDGRFGINAILFDEAALWCGPCQQEAMGLAGFMAASWGADGVNVVSLVVQDLQQQPSTLANAMTWRTQFKLQGIWVAADPAWIFSHQGTNGLPMNVLVDPRTMKIVKILEGYGGQDPAVDALAKKNKTM